MVCIIIFGYRSFGKCDYFKLGNGETDKYYYVRTQFFHLSFLPLCPVKSYIATDNGDCCGVDKVLMVLPETSTRSILWAWLRCLTFFLAIVTMATAGMFYSLDDRPADQMEVWKLIVPFVAATLLVIVGSALQFYHPKATEERRQEYIEMILARFGRVVAQSIAEERGQVMIVPSAQASAANVQAQQPNYKATGPPAYTEGPPEYGYDQAPIQNFQPLPSVQNQGGGNVV